MYTASACAEWIAVDWGTSNLRVWVYDAQGQVFAHHQSERGMGSLTRDEFEGALLELIEPYLSTGYVVPVVCCGMVGSRQGWAEAAYKSVPCKPPNGDVATRVTTNDRRISVSILPGVKQIAPPDVMRGEETQIAGFLNLNQGFEGVICLPGTHTKWVAVQGGKITGFTTFMTGEMFALLSRKSVLRHCVTAEGFDQASFETAVNDALINNQALAAELFGLRAGSLVADLPPAAARARLSGLLIGDELAAARSLWRGQQVAMIGDSGLVELYRAGIARQGQNPIIVDVTEMTLNGLAAAYQSLREPIK